MEPIIACPNCNEFIIVEKLNCGIFRHGIIKENGKQMDPHLGKEQCDFFIDNNLIYGCGKPFQIINENGVWKIRICDYI